MKKILITLFIVFISISGTNAWLWLIAENWDLLNITKWNELVADKLSRSDLKAWDNVTLTNSGSEIYINWMVSWNWVPFIWNEDQIWMPINQTKTVTIIWRNFTPETTVSTVAWTIANLQILSPVELNFDLTTGSIEWEFDVILDNDWVQNTYWTGNWVNLINVWNILWNWPSWTYSEDFETNTLWNWVEVSWLTANVSFQTRSWWTPSSNTWPDDGAGASTYYIYTEASSPNYANKTFAIETDYFHHATSISFDYHMYGDTMWDLIVQTLYDWTWTDVYTISWQQQTSNTDVYLNTWNIDLTPYQTEKIRFFYTSWSSYTWDCALDNIVITSD